MTAPRVAPHAPVLQQEHCHEGDGPAVHAPGQVGSRKMERVGGAVLVDEAALPTVESILSMLGYRQQSPLPPTFYAKHHRNMPFLHPARGLWVEVQHGLFPPPSHLGTDRLFSREALDQ